MVPTYSFDWLFTSIGYSLAAAGALLLVWSLFWDRARNRRRCPRCWYDMAGIAGLRCPECGREARTERRLTRTRRKWWRAALAVAVILLGAGVARTPDITRNGWYGAVPSTVLLCWPHAKEFHPPFSPNSASYPFRIPKPEGAAAELLRRYNANLLYHWQQRLASRAQPDYTPRKWLGAVWSPPRSPTSAPLRVHVMPSAIEGTRTRRMVITGLFPGGRRAEAIHEKVGPRSGKSAFDIGVPPDGPTVPVLIEVFESGRGDAPGEATVKLCAEHTTLKVSVGGTIDEILRPIDSPEALLAMNSLSVTAVDEAGGELYVTLRPAPALAGATLGLSIEITHAGERLATAECTVQVPEASAGAQWWVPYEGNPAHLATRRPGDPAWTVRVRADGLTALRDPHAKSFWRGELTLPLNREESR